MSDLPRLLLCAYDVLPGPTALARRFIEYLKATEERFQVVVLSIKTADHSHIEKVSGARLLRVPVGGGDLRSRLLTFDRAVRRQLESEEYAICHFADPFGGYAISELKANLGFKTVYEALAFPSLELPYTHPETDGDRRFLAKMRRQELFCLMNADVVVTGSAGAAERIKALGVSEDALHPLPAPVELAAYHPEVKGSPKGKLRALYLGSLAPWQGVGTAIKALGLVGDRADIELAVVSPPHAGWQALMEEQAAEAGVGSRVHFQPPCAPADVPKVVAAADVGLLPLGNCERNLQQAGPFSKAADYLAGGRPVVASDLLPVRAQLGSAAVYATADDPAAWADALVALAQDPVARGSYARAALKAAQPHDAARARSAVLGIYRRLLPGSLPEVAGPLPQPAEEQTDRGRLPLAASRAEPTTDPDAAPTPVTERDGAGPSAGINPSSRVVMGTPLSQPERPAQPAAAQPPARGEKPTDPLSAPRGPKPADPPSAAVPPPARIERSAAPAAMPTLPRAEKAPAAPLPQPVAARPPLSAPERVPAPTARGPLVPWDDREGDVKTEQAMPPVPSAPVKLPRPALPFITPTPLTATPIVARPPEPRRTVIDEIPEVDEVEEVQEVDEVEAISDADQVNEPPVPPPSRAAVSAPPPSNPEHEEIENADDAIMEPTGRHDMLQFSVTEFWLSQLLYGYCPPSNLDFARPTPPTNFPGRDEVPVPGAPGAKR